MKTPKEHALDLLRRLPDDVSMEEIVRQMEFVASIRRGLADIERGDWITDEEMKARVQRWIDSGGRRKMSEE